MSRMSVSRSLLGQTSGPIDLRLKASIRRESDYRTLSVSGLMQCEAGKHSQSSTSCSNCMAGKFSAAPATLVCSDCLAGLNYTRPRAPLPGKLRSFYLFARADGMHPAQAHTAAFQARPAAETAALAPTQPKPPRLDAQTVVRGRTWSRRATVSAASACRASTVTVRRKSANPPAPLVRRANCLPRAAALQAPAPMSARQALQGQRARACGVRRYVCVCVHVCACACMCVHARACACILKSTRSCSLTRLISSTPTITHTPTHRASTRMRREARSVAYAKRMPHRLRPRTAASASEATNSSIKNAYHVHPGVTRSSATHLVLSVRPVSTGQALGPGAKTAYPARIPMPRELSSAPIVKRARFLPTWAPLFVATVLPTQIPEPARVLARAVQGTRQQMVERVRHVQRGSTEKRAQKPASTAATTLFPPLAPPSQQHASAGQDTPAAR